MAKVVVYGGFSLGDIANAWDYGDVISQTSTVYSLLYDNDNGGITLRGNNITYSGSAIASGVITSITATNSDGSIEWTMTGLSVSAKDLRDAAYYDSANDYDDLLSFFRTVPMTFIGGVDEDVVYGGSYADKISGGHGADRIIGREGADTLNGGGVQSATATDFDILDYSLETGGGGVVVNLATGKAKDTYGFVDSISNFEIITGTDAADTFTAANANVVQGFAGGKGADVFNGGTGKLDTVYFDMLDGDYSTDVDLAAISDGKGYAYGSYGNDTLSSIEIIRANGGYNDLRGSSASETFSAGDYTDTIDGRDGSDVIDYGYDSGNRAVFVNLSQGYAVDTYNYADVLISIENVIGTNKSDRITGSGSTNRLVGNDGNDQLRGLGAADIISGGNGNDRIEGGTGNDILTGGSGFDSFIFTGATGTSNVDQIMDFKAAEDTIWLDSAFFSAIGPAGVLASTGFMSNLTGNAVRSTDRIIYEQDTGELYYDSNGSSANGSVLIATLTKNLSLSGENFFIY